MALELTPAVAGGLSLTAAGGGSVNGGGPRDVGDIPVWDGSGYDYLNYWFDVRSYGNGLESGESGDEWTEAIQAALDAAEEAGAGVVVLPAGTFMTENFSWTASNVFLRGAGRGATILKAVTGTGISLIDIAASGGGVSDLTVDCDGQTAGHGIRASGDDLTFRNLAILESPAYGMGLAQAADSSLRRCLIDNVYILNSALDGIDSKNRANLNYGNRISNVVVENHGSGSTIQAGIDCRGPWTLTNIVVRGYEGDDVGVRFRSGETVDSNGLGGHGSSLTNFHIVSSESATSNCGGVSSNARDVQISNGYIETEGYGVQAGASSAYNAVTNVFARCPNSIGFWGFDDYTSFVNCRAVGCNDGFRIDGDNCQIIGGLAKDGARYGVNPVNTSVRITDLLFSSNATNNINYTSTASADPLTLPAFTDYIPITGTTTITSITASWKGRVVTLKFAGILTFTDGSNLKLNGNFVTSADDTITLVCDGTDFYEVCRSAN